MESELEAFLKWSQKTKPSRLGSTTMLWYTFHLNAGDIFLWSIGLRVLCMWFVVWPNKQTKKRNRKPQMWNLQQSLTLRPERMELKIWLNNVERSTRDRKKIVSARLMAFLLKTNYNFWFVLQLHSSVWLITEHNHWLNTIWLTVCMIFCVHVFHPLSWIQLLFSFTHSFYLFFHFIFDVVEHF